MASDQSSSQEESIEILHHSDNPVQSLVSTLLHADDYSSWQRAVIIALSARNKFGFVGETLL